MDQEALHQETTLAGGAAMGFSFTWMTSLCEEECQGFWKPTSEFLSSAVYLYAQLVLHSFLMLACTVFLDTSLPRLTTAFTAR